MKKLIVAVFQNFIFSIIIGFVCYFMTRSLLWSMGIAAGIFLCTLIGPVYKIVNYFFRKSKRFRDAFDYLKFVDVIPQNLEVVNLGSSSGKYAFDYNSLKIKGANWALAPQTLYYDFVLLKQFHSYLRPGARVLIPLCPFSGCIINFTDTKINGRYCAFLHPAMLSDDLLKQAKISVSFLRHPLWSSLRILGCKKFIRDIGVTFLKRDPGNWNMNPLNELELEQEAQRRIESWKEQFCIEDLTAAVSKKNGEMMEYNAGLLEAIVKFCLERSLQPVIVLPPVSAILYSKFPDSFKETYIFPLLAGVDCKCVRILDYWDEQFLQEKDLYYNSFLLNSKGRKLFTHKVFQDLELL